MKKQAMQDLADGLEFAILAVITYFGKERDNVGNPELAKDPSGIFADWLVGVCFVGLFSSTILLKAFTTNQKLFLSLRGKGTLWV